MLVNELKITKIIKKHEVEFYWIIEDGTFKFWFKLYMHLSKELLDKLLKIEDQEFCIFDVVMDPYIHYSTNGLKKLDFKIYNFEF